MGSGFLSVAEFSPEGEDLRLKVAVFSPLDPPKFLSDTSRMLISANFASL